MTQIDTYNPQSDTDAQLEVFDGQNELAMADVHSLTSATTQAFHNIIQDIQPVFQLAYQQGDEQSQALVMERWQLFQDAVLSVGNLTDTVKQAVQRLKQQRDVSVKELDRLVQEVRDAAMDQRSSKRYQTDPEDMALDRVDEAYRRYSADVAELIVATEDRVNEDFEYERDSFYSDVYPRINQTVLADIAAMVTVRCDSDDMAVGRALIPVLSSVDDLTEAQRQAARATLKRLLEMI